MNIPTYQELEDKVLELAVQLANAESKCRELAAENAGQKQSKPSLKTMMSALDAFYADEDVPESAMLIAFNILRGDIETPATDYFLSEVRAQAIRGALDESADHLDTDCVMDRLDISYEDAELRTSGAIELHDALVAVANELRKGTAK
ncbi:hypothetical protein WHZ76_10025 [Citrobacter portucalensis]|uniref:hypothetical protein n=1 Tax=Citrobacter portucalensis TaxID=1639133 RepID=UPI00339C717D